MTTNPTAPSAEAIEAAARAEKEWLRDNCGHCGRTFATTEDWATTTSGARSDLCWEPDGTCSWVFSSIDPVVRRTTAILTTALPLLSVPEADEVEQLRAMLHDAERLDVELREARTQRDEAVAQVERVRAECDALLASNEDRR